MSDRGINDKLSKSVECSLKILNFEEACFIRDLVIAYCISLNFKIEVFTFMQMERLFKESAYLMKALI